MAGHDWIPSSLGHGETMCRYCYGTNRELAVLGQLNHCDKAPDPNDPDRIKKRAIMAMAGTICACDLTDGFCAPERKPDCQCIKYARMAWEGLGTRGLKICWPTARVNPFCARALEE